MNNLQNKINYQFKDTSLLMQALTHKSYANEHKLKYNYERLEYLGDTVLQLVTSDYLFTKFPNADEGTLTKYRASLVSEQALSKRAKEIGLNEYILLGKGERKTDGANKPSILCDVVESLIGAIYTDCRDYDVTEAFIYDYLIKGVEIIDYDYKTRLQEQINHIGGTLEYKVINEVGADHDKIFTVAVVINGHTICGANGRTKKQAEQMASKQALEMLRASKVL